jgi:hypothetical protein
LAGDKEIYNMQTHYPAFHAEYWVYMLAAFVMVVLGTLLYTVDGPIKFSSWFCRSFTLVSISDDERIGLCSPVRPTPPTRPDIEADAIASPINLFGSLSSS